MDRRTFLKAAGSLAVLLPWTGQKAFAQSPSYKGPFLLCVHAAGGWDPTMFFDPKLPYENNTINRTYDRLESLGPFSYAPIDFLQNPSNNTSVWLHSPAAFLRKYGESLLLLNGVDTETNAHPIGEQIVWSGHVASEYPSIGALLAIKASQSLDLPCAYLVNSGSYTKTLGLVPLSQMDASTISNIAYEGYFRGSTPANTPGPNLLSPQTSQRIRQANAQRVQYLNQQLSLPESKEALSRYNKAVLAQSGLASFADSLPAQRITVTDSVWRPGANNTGNINAALQLAQMALYGFLTGTTTSASISYGAFDTHDNNDQNQRIYLGHLFVLIDYILTEAKTLGVSDSLYVIVGSDFGRTNRYSGSGKDHWNVTSLMAFGPNIRGNRVVGATDDDQHPAYVNPQNPSQRLPKNSGGIVLKPWHVHRELRRVLGLGQFDTHYGLLDKSIPLFG